MRHSYARVFLLTLLLSVGLSALAATKAGFVSVNRVLKESLPAQNAQRVIDAEFVKRDQELAALAGQFERAKSDLERDLITLSDAERLARERALNSLSAELQRRQREFTEDLSQRRNEELAAVMQRLREAVTQIAKAEDYDIVFGDAVWADRGIDITDKVIKTMDAALERESAVK